MAHFSAKCATLAPGGAQSGRLSFTFIPAHTTGHHKFSFPFSLSLDSTPLIRSFSRDRPLIYVCLTRHPLQSGLLAPAHNTHRSFPLSFSPLDSTFFLTSFSGSVSTRLLSLSLSLDSTKLNSIHSNSPSLNCPLNCMPRLEHDRRSELCNLRRFK